MLFPFIIFCAALCLVTHLFLTLCDPMECSPLGSSVHGNFPGKYWSGFPGPPPWIFPTQGSNPGLLLCRQTLYSLSHQGSLKYMQILKIRKLVFVFKVSEKEMYFHICVLK